MKHPVTYREAARLVGILTRSDVLAAYVDLCQGRASVGMIWSTQAIRSCFRRIQCRLVPGAAEHLRLGLDAHRTSTSRSSGT